MLPKNFPNRRQRRADEANERNAHSSSLTIEQRLQVIASRPGESKRERERLSRPKKGKPVVVLAAQDPVVQPVEREKAPPKSDRKAQKAWKKKHTQANED